MCIIHFFSGWKNLRFNRGENNMKEDTKNVSRRNFLAKSAGAAAVASILVIENSAAPNTGSVINKAKNATSSLACPTITPLTNTMIRSQDDNILGTDYVNVKEFLIGCDNDITDALDAAIAYLSSGGNPAPGNPKGGQILIPSGRWKSRGGHNLQASISIEGVGTQIDPDYFGVPWGTEIELFREEKEKFNDYMFRIQALHHNVSLKNLSINVSANEDAIGLLMTDGAAELSHLKYTAVENVNFTGGAYGIKVDSAYNFECIQHRFERVIFNGCKTSFYNNTVNCGYSFDTCYFLIPNEGTALHIVTAGNIAVEHSLFVPSGGTVATDGIILKTIGAFNSITFYNCQDEGIPYAYQNDVNPYDYIPVVYKNCLIQSLFKFNSHGSIILDTCRVYSVDTIGMTTIGGCVIDSATAAARVYLKGQYNFFRWVPTIMYLGAPIATFNNAGSQLIIESNEVGQPEIIAASASVPAYYVINKSRGLINLDTGTSYIVVYNNLVSTESMVFAQLQTYDSGGARIREVQCSAGIIQINLTANAASKLRIAFKVEV